MFIGNCRPPLSATIPGNPRKASGLKMYRDRLPSHLLLQELCAQRWWFNMHRRCTTPRNISLQSLIISVFLRVHLAHPGNSQGPVWLLTFPGDFPPRSVGGLATIWWRSEPWAPLLSHLAPSLTPIPSAWQNRGPTSVLFPVMNVSVYFLYIHFHGISWRLGE